LIPFELLEPRTLPEALGMLADDDTAVRPIGGGTALMLMMKASVFVPRRLVSLRGLGEALGGITLDATGALCLGSTATLSALEQSDLVRAHAPVITRAMPHLSNVRVRHVATVGGALAHADPHMDLPTILTCLDARVAIAGPGGNRELAVDELITGYYETSLGRNEIITGVKIAAAPTRKAAYVKCTTRAADDWPALGVAVSLLCSGGRIDAARLVIGAATDKPTRVPAAEAALEGAAFAGGTLAAGVVDTVRDAVAREVDYTSDTQGSAAYKRQLARVHVVRALTAALEA
jgi:carbon-monoxide dehydrogenase medium subunit